MSDLPDGWAWTDAATVTEVQGGIQKQPKRRPVLNRYPFLRVANVMRGHLDLSEVHEIELFDGEIERFRLRAGDLLVVEGNGSLDQIGRAALWNGDIQECVHQNHLIRVRPTAAITSKYLAYCWNAPQTTRYLRSVASSTSGLHVLTTSKVRSVRIPLPPLAEQSRIVAAIEEQFSRLDTGLVTLERAHQGLWMMRASILNGLLQTDAGAFYPEVPLEEILERGRYGTSAKCSADASGLPVLRIPNIQSGRIDLRDLKYAIDTKVDLKGSKVEPGDVLIIRTNGSRSLIGRGAVVSSSESEMAFASYLIQLKVDRSAIDPAYLASALSAPLMRRKIEVLAATTAGQYNISLGKLRTLRIPLPSLAQQRNALSKVGHLLSAADHMQRDIANSRTRAGHLRSSILEAAFSGKLT